MSILTRESEDIGKVFDDLCLSRKVVKKAEGTQTPPLRDVSVPGEVPDQCVTTLIEMLTLKPADMVATDEEWLINTNDQRPVSKGNPNNLEAGADDDKINTQSTEKNHQKTRSGRQVKIPQKPSLRQHYSSKANSHTSNDDDSSESTPLLTEVKEISVDRTRSKSKKMLIEEHSSTEMKKVFEELCLSRKNTSFTKSSDQSSSQAQPKEQDGEIPDQNVSSLIEMLRPSIRQLHMKNGLPTKEEKNENNSDSNENVIRAYQSEPTVGPVTNLNLSSTLSDVSLDSIFTTPSNLTDTIDENLIKTLLSSQHELDLQMSKGFVETGSNTEYSGKHSRRKSRKRRKKSRVKLIKDSGTDTIYQTEDSTNQTEDLSSKETEELLNDTMKSSTKILEIKEQCDLSIELERKSSKEVQVENGITILRNRTDWTDTPFLPQDSSETVEESTSNVDSEPTRGCPSALQYKIQFNSADKSSSKTKTEIKRLKAILHSGKRPLDKESEYNHNKDFQFNNFFSKPITNTCTVSSPFGISNLDSNIEDRMFPSHSSLSSPENSTATSLTSIRTYSCSSCYEEKLGQCCCNSKLTDTPAAPGEPKVFWAITKINVYPDDSRTYEVMPLTGKKPAELPEKSDSVFVLIPPKPGQYVQSNLE